MKKLCNSICIAFSTFSVFPVPHIEWTKENMRYMLCSLPLVGCVIGGVMAGCDRLCRFLELNNVFRAALLTTLPIILSGGIHLDGFCDTADAMASRAEPERKREIMKDSHAGAFAIIAFGTYLLMYFAACFSVCNSMVFFFIPVLSRSVGAVGGTVFRGSDGKGLLSIFRDGASGISALVLAVWLLLCVAGLFFTGPWYAVAGTTAAVLCLMQTKRMVEKHFQGMSGDLAGHLNVLTELSALLLCVLAEKLGGI